VQPLRPFPDADTLASATARIGDQDVVAAKLLDQVDAAIAADLNTPKVLAILQDTLREPAITRHGQGVVVAACDALLGLGLASLDPRDLDGRRDTASLTTEERRAIEKLVADRTGARAERDWARADQIRGELEKLGVQVTDTPDGPTWDLR
jgi:cysteinyl-tRNA synthetase